MVKESQCPHSLSDANQKWRHPRAWLHTWQGNADYEIQNNMNICYTHTAHLIIVQAHLSTAEDFARSASISSNVSVSLVKYTARYPIACPNNVWSMLIHPANKKIQPSDTCKHKNNTTIGYMQIIYYMREPGGVTRTVASPIVHW